jgi:hypothetical protein
MLREREKEREERVTSRQLDGGLKRNTTERDTHTHTHRERRTEREVHHDKGAIDKCVASR